MKKYIVFLFVIFLFPINSNALTDTSKSSIVMDLESGRILYSKNPNDVRLIASTTKIMTAIIALENSNIEKEVTVGDEVLKMYGTNIYVEVGEKMSIKNLLYGLLLRSGNDASVVIAKNVGNTEKEFVKMMNKKAKELNMKNTTFSNPHGLDDETKNYSTAYDMALLSSYAYKNKVYREIASTKKHEVSNGKKTYLWYNRNKLLSQYEYATGGKNGYTPDAGKTLVTTASKDDLNLTIVTLNDSNPYENHKNLYTSIYDKYKKYTVIDKNNFKVDKNYFDGDLYIKKSFSYPLTEDEKDNVKTLVSITNENKEKVGKITIYLDKEIIGTIPIYQKEKEKEEQSLLSKIKSLFTR